MKSKDTDYKKESTRLYSPDKSVEITRESPLVSVIIPVYNTDKYLSECLDSVVNQTLKNIEIICVNDGSTDNSFSIISKYAEKDTRFKIVTQKNQGQAVARNKGIKMATGKYIYMIDSDDWIEKDTLETIYNECEKRNLEVLFFDATKFYEEEKKFCNGQKDFKRRQYSEIYDGITFSKITHDDNNYIVSPCLFLISSIFLKRHAIYFYEGIIHEDDLFCFNILMNAKRVSHIERRFYHRRIRANSTMTSPVSRKNVIGYFTCMLEMLKYGLSTNYDAKKSKEIWRTFMIMRTVCKNRFSKISQQEKSSIYFENQFVQMMFDVFIINNDEFVNEENFLDGAPSLVQRLKIQEGQIRELSTEIKNIHSSKTYRIGHIITWGPRMFRGMIYCYREHGFNYTMKRIFAHLKVNKGIGADQDDQFQQMEKQPTKTKKRDYNYYASLSSDKYAEELKLWYERITKSSLDLDNPQTFNEKIQWLKLYDSTPLKTRLADKYLVRDWVKEKIGEQYLVPLLGVWNSFDEIDFDKLPDQFVLKANHGSGWNYIVKDKSKFDKEDARKKFDVWMHKNFAFQFGFELQYMNIPPKIIAEKYIEEFEQVYDYKVMCFNGHAKFIWVDTDRFTSHHRTLFTLNWERMNVTMTWPTAEHEIPKPSKLDKMVEMAEKLSKGFAHVRVDFYYVHDHIYFGEMTFTSSSGTERAMPREFERRMGDWIVLPPKSPIPERKEF